jgi:broad specificity polyphosphatase/5'/3'-nucleotidase SurE
VPRQCEWPEKPRGVRWTRQAVKRYDGKVVPGKDPMKRAIYWFTIKPLKGEERKAINRWAFNKNFVSITPLPLDLPGFTGAKSAGEIDEAKFISLTDNK